MARRLLPVVDVAVGVAIGTTLAAIYVLRPVFRRLREAQS